MSKLFDGKKFFAFLASFLFTFVIGFFLWSGVNSKFFTASLSAPESAVLDEEQIVASDENLAEESSEEKSAFVEVLTDKQDLLDDMAEKLDIISQQVQDLQNQQSPNIDEQDQKPDDEETDKTDKNIEITENLSAYPKILISELGVAGDNDDKQELVELYNPTGQDVDLTGWYLQRKTSVATSWSSYVSSSLFSGKKISANGYFLIARSGYYIGAVDIFVNNPITNDNSFALKNPDGETSDELGFGNCSDSEISCAQNPNPGQSIGRKVLPDNTEQDTDNNSDDFELDNLTPSWPNKTYTAPANATVSSGGSSVEGYPKILISEIQILPIAQRFVELYNPNSQDIDLTGWYLQRKTKDKIPEDGWDSFVSAPNFSGKVIGSNDYFLISKDELPGGSSDIFTDNAIAIDDSFALKNPKGDISDKVGLGQTKNSETVSIQNPAENQSVGRIFDETSQTYLDTDNNSTDFELDTPTPRAKNTKWIEPVVEPDPPPPPTSLIVTLYTLQVSGQSAVSDNNVFINSSNGAKMQVTTNEPCKFEIWINGKKYWYTTTFSMSISRPSSGCNFWRGTQNSCNGDVLPDGIYPITIKITDGLGNVVINTTKTITVDNSVQNSENEL